MNEEKDDTILYPTMLLRWIDVRLSEKEPTAQISSYDNYGEKELVLQQKWVTESGTEVWLNIEKEYNP